MSGVNVFFLLWRSFVYTEHDFHLILGFNLSTRTLVFTLNRELRKGYIHRQYAFYKSKCLSVCPSVRLSVRLFTFEVPFKRLFAPTSPSRMSNIFRLEHFCLEVV